jgi:hypothetical protein
LQNDSSFLLPWPTYIDFVAESCICQVKKLERLSPSLLLSLFPRRVAFPLFLPLSPSLPRSLSPPLPLPPPASVPPPDQASPGPSAPRPGSPASPAIHLRASGSGCQALPVLGPLGPPKTVTVSLQHGPTQREDLPCRWKPRPARQ